MQHTKIKSNFKLTEFHSFQVDSPNINALRGDHFPPLYFQDTLSIYMLFNTFELLSILGHGSQTFQEQLYKF